LAATALLLGASAAVGAPVTKQNGTNPLFKNFTSICAVSGYAGYGLCNGDPKAFTSVTGRINAVQAKPGVWNLGLSFAGLQPGAAYKLWGNQPTAPSIPFVLQGFFPIATVTAGVDGTASYSYQTTDPTNLGFDLNVLQDWSDFYGFTVVTSFWSNQTIQVLNSNGTLYVP
jgi:hypothetical protein